MRNHAIRIAVALGLALMAGRAEAFPAFARKYGMSCSACHVAWPILNQVGESFRDNGYQFGLGKDDAATRDPSYLPVSLRTTPQYLYTETTNQPVADGTGTGGAKAVTTRMGGIQAPTGVDILTGGAITPEISYLLVIAGFGSDGTSGVESAFVRFNRLARSQWLNFKVGKFELELPASAHRGVSLASPGYVAYQGLQDNQVGVELSGHDENSSARYALALISLDGGAGLSKGAWSTPMLHARGTKSWDLGSGGMPWLRVGASAAVGSLPTNGELVLGTDVSGENLLAPGTGTSPKSLGRYGVDVSGILGHPSTPFVFTLAFLGGFADKAFVGTGAEFKGGFLEVDWVPWSVASENPNPWMFFARYDVLRPKGGGNFDGYTVGARRYLIVGPRASAAVHVELHTNKQKDAGVDPTKGVDTTAFMAGVDFDF